jgi:hypothetical protein
MIKIDNSLLQELGLANLPDVEKNSLLKHIYETLEMRVGMRLADQMTNQQLDEFEQYFEAKDDQGAFKWLESNFPNYKEIVQEEFDKLKIEVGQSAPQIMASSNASAQQQPQMSAPQPAQSQPSVDQQPPTPAPAQPYAAPPQPQYAQDFQQPTQQPVYQPQPQGQQMQSPLQPQTPQPVYQAQQYPPQQPPAGPQQ